MGITCGLPWTLTQISWLIYKRFSLFLSKKRLHCICTIALLSVCATFLPEYLCLVQLSFKAERCIACTSIRPNKMWPAFIYTIVTTCNNLFKPVMLCVFNALFQFLPSDNCVCLGIFRMGKFRGGELLCVCRGGVYLSFRSLLSFLFLLLSERNDLCYKLPVGYIGLHYFPYAAVSLAPL